LLLAAALLDAVSLSAVVVIEKKKKKNSAFKCYLSKSTMYKEDPHWYDILGARGDGDLGLTLS